VGFVILDKAVTSLVRGRKARIDRSGINLQGKQKKIKRAVRKINC
jgi:hypothetical protein